MSKTELLLDRFCVIGIDDEDDVGLYATTSESLLLLSLMTGIIGLDILTIDSVEKNEGQ